MSDEIKEVVIIETLNADEITLFLGELFEKELSFLQWMESFELKIYIHAGKFSHYNLIVNGERWKGGVQTDLERLLDKFHGGLESNYREILEIKKFYNFTIRVLDGDFIMPILFEYTQKSSDWWNHKRSE